MAIWNHAYLVKSANRKEGLYIVYSQISNCGGRIAVCRYNLSHIEILGI